MKIVFALATLLSILASASASLASPAPAYEGRRLFVSYCQLCHGPTGKGDGALAQKMEITPADLTTTVRSRSDTILRKIITGEGGPTISGRVRHNMLSDAMPGWGEVFTGPQIEALIAYLRFLSTSNHDLMGNPDVGYKLYQQYCTVCHGEFGEGDGIMTKLMDIEPADHSNVIAMDPITNDELVTTIQQGRGHYMPAWDTILTREEIEALVSYIRLLSN